MSTDPLTWLDQHFHPELPLFFLIAPAPTEIYTLSLHDALPICDSARPGRARCHRPGPDRLRQDGAGLGQDRKSTRLNSSHEWISYAVFCLKKKTNKRKRTTPAVTIHVTSRALVARPRLE